MAGRGRYWSADGFALALPKELSRALAIAFRVHSPDKSVGTVSGNSKEALPSALREKFCSIRWTGRPFASSRTRVSAPLAGRSSSLTSSTWNARWLPAARVGWKKLR